MDIRLLLSWLSHWATVWHVLLCSLSMYLESFMYPMALLEGKRMQLGSIVYVQSHFLNEQNALECRV